MIHFDLNWMVYGAGGGGHCDPHKQYHFLDYAAEKKLFKAFIKKVQSSWPSFLSKVLLRFRLLLFIQFDLC